MKAVVQRVTKASVSIDKAPGSVISEGLVVFLGVGKEDSPAEAAWLCEKILNLRIFANEQGRFDRSVSDIKGELLIISQFTLYGDSRRGRRPDFTAAAEPKKALELYNEFVSLAAKSGLVIKTGEFAADMLVELSNNGPVTIILDSHEK
ncbi:MAG TPA: D-tyrosyl-tRNA(Tyr) deacylase [Elusimicrobia bacterium]|nr:MAG: D-tyrosyl-tRNA(Tyr) deacylase [Elusimicrobia bacterium RIFOXYA12_FULL_49_49]OGS10038.1 MAG: D-tyrosyl-tRNA(Tyr) deacylase [Elusimicrobia bacterium RIFOXYA1_FULL_47_7]OGS16053.1 MAG: D-tyrosyl-tRNA(Tyr) deacylase [Elusimicrobia bacterium RIFOXYA2_FULL_47_53]OGS25776.1 MAG: D-tyrosyl-tRNA(Tyr) deacylase [Elusimicrobia bacterium RIFOXYB12_FULL_50_12]OGS30195.1 MAG: D-tyrosyl-tRNA(Tyr) deacylase [Elusimicrobia bacterium RIFOXYB2_FULL_46_23]HBU69304.1 D-tyrosyl-tRNA(Tyr) deacylase [Elusimic